MCPVCGSDDAWVRGRVRSRQEGHKVRTTVECKRCGSASEVTMTLDTYDQQAIIRSETDPG